MRSNIHPYAREWLKGAFLIVLFLLGLFAATKVWGGKTHTLNFYNQTKHLIIHVVVVDADYQPPEEGPMDPNAFFIADFMLSPGEEYVVIVPPGHYHIFTSCTAGVNQFCLITDRLRYPDKPVEFYLRAPAHLDKPSGKWSESMGRRHGHPPMRVDKAA